MSELVLFLPFSRAGHLDTEKLSYLPGTTQESWDSSSFSMEPPLGMQDRKSGMMMMCTPKPQLLGVEASRTEP